MERLLQQFEQPIADAAGTTYNVYVYGRSRPADTWQGWLVFERLTDGRRFSTDVETTQPSAEAILYWATGLTDAYFDGALVRAMNAVETDHRPIAVPPPLVGGLVDSDTRTKRLADLEREVLALFQHHGTTRLLTRTVLDGLPHAHADVVRALENLEKQGGLLSRRTEEGNDWIFLTPVGARAAGVSDGVPADRNASLPRNR
ncbi:MAG TPA: hypothetical protein VFV49_17080 [Thermoanaerobaculia bacterium]|nr:hypothetical protein [Thermoanaerobaculia bacterium]